jgi:hypothetical protein
MDDSDACDDAALAEWIHGRRRVWWERPLVLVFGRDFMRIPLGLLLDPMLSGHLRGNLFQEGIRPRRELLAR